MKKTLLSLLTAIVAATTSFAQPVLDSAALCPLPKDVFIGHIPLSVTGILPGASGPSATWNFSTIADDSQDSTVYLACSATTYCSSFSPYGSNLACFNDNGDFGPGYYYFVTDSNHLTLIGGNVSSITAHALNGQDVQFFSLQYMKIHLDTSEVAVAGIYHYQQDSSTVDGYGNLTLPTGSYTNVLRVMTTSMAIDSTVGSAPDTTYTQDYNWYAAGFRHSLLNITIDTAFGNTVEYYTKGTYVDISLSAATVTLPHTMQLYPNPATSEINIKFNLERSDAAALFITDITGRVVGNIPSSQMKQGVNDISFSVAGLLDGVYIVRLTSGAESMVQRIVVAK